MFQPSLTLTPFRGASSTEPSPILLNCKKCCIKRCERTSKGASTQALHARKVVTLERRCF
jgi:hypothetical protein